MHPYPHPDARRWPAPLVPGSVVTVVAPSGPCLAERVRSGAAVLESWGLEVRYGAHVFDAHDRLRYLSADDAARAADLTAAWTDADTDAIWAARGGYGAQRMVDLVDYDALRAAGPKALLGFSDITALHTRIGRELDLVTWHAPSVASLSQLTDPPTVASLQELVLQPPQPGAMLCRGTMLSLDPSGADQGEVTGTLIGGNLSLLASDLGIEPLPSRPSVVLLEDVGEDGYRVDRMLTSLLRAGWFASVVGVVVGDFTESDDADLVEQVLAERLAGLRVPVLRGAEVGHGSRNLALPLGAQVTLGDGLLRLAG